MVGCKYSDPKLIDIKIMHYLTLPTYPKLYLSSKDVFFSSATNFISKPLIMNDFRFQDALYFYLKLCSYIGNMKKIRS